MDALNESNITPDESEKVGETPKCVKARSKTQPKSLAKVHKGDENPGSSKEKSKTLHDDTVTFEDDDNFVSMEAVGHLSDNFPSEPEEGELSNVNPDNSNSQTKDSHGISSQPSSKDNAEQETSSSSDQSSEDDSSSSDDTEPPAPKSKQYKERSRHQSSQAKSPCNNFQSGRVEDTIHLMQQFMITQGLIDESMNAAEICEFIKGTQVGWNKKDNHTARKKESSRQKGNAIKKVGNEMQSPSEVTIYKNAVEMPDECNMSSSSDKPINTSVDSLERMALQWLQSLNKGKNMFGVSDTRDVSPWGSRSRSHSRSRRHSRG